MSQRLMVHPRTGEALKPIYVSEKTGRVYWPILGAADDDDSNKDSSGDASGDASKDDKDADGNKDSEGSDGKSDDKSGDTVSKAEYEALKARMQAADKAKSEAEKKAKEYEDKDKSDLEKAQGEVKTLQEENGKLAETVKALRLENAFALNNSVEWNDPALVLDIVRKREDVTIDDDGNVKGIDNAVKAIAKDKPYLVKNGDKNGAVKSGSSTGSGNSDKDKPDQAKLRQRFRI